jgi:hypothetical protein
MLSNEIFGNENGLKDRVTACRKRLRLNRIHRAHRGNQLEEMFQEIAMASEFRGYSGDPVAMRESLVESVHVRDDETAQRVDGQEVGIT